MYLTSIYEYPHGDSSVYSVIVRLAQYFQMYPIYLIPQGNYGSIAGDSAAAMRYTETNMTRFCWNSFFKYWKNDIIDFKPTFDNEGKEPLYLMATYPTVLLKGSFGLGYGLYTGIPPFNFTEVLKSVIKLLENPKAKIRILPDFPVACHLVNTNFDEIFEKGEGNFRVRGIITEENGNLVIESIPYQTNTADIVARIVNLSKDKKLNGLTDIVDESKRITEDGVDKTDIRIVLKTKKGAPLEQIKEIIFKSTPMEQTFAVNFELVDGTENVHYNLKGLLLDWIEFAREMKTRLALYEYKSLSKEYHMKITVSDILSEPGSDKVILGIMRDNKNKKAQAEALVKRYEKYKLTELQAKVILDWKLTQYSKETLEKFRSDVLELEKKLKVKKEEIYNIDKIDQLIIEDMKDGIKEFGKSRISEVIEVRESDYVENSEHRIIITKKGYIKKLNPNALDDVDDVVGTIDQGDKVLHILEINNRDSLLIFDSKGKCYKLPVNDIMNNYKQDIGVELNSYINTDNKIISVMQMPSEKEADSNLIFVSKNGTIKKSSISNYLGVNKGGLIAVSLKNEDKIVDVIKLGRVNKDILIYTANGKAIRFNTKDIPATLRMSAGVTGIKLEDDDIVTGMVKLDKNKNTLVVLTSNGNGKRCPLENLEKATRGKSGSNLIRMKDKEKIVGIKVVDSDEDIDIIFNNRIETINVKKVPKLTLIAEGKSIVNVKRSEYLVSLD